MEKGRSISDGSGICMSLGVIPGVTTGATVIGVRGGL